MPIFGSKTILLVFLNNANLKLAQYKLTPRGASLVTSDTLVFSDGVVKDSSVSNKEEFLKEVSKFINAKPDLKNSDVLFAIPEEKTFLKGFVLELGDLERKEEFRETFLNEIPFLKEELFVKERLDGRILEFAAVSKKYLEDLRQPFSALGMKVAGVISASQALARYSSPKERSSVFTFYDNDFALSLVQNSSVLFSETERMDRKDAAKQFLSAVKHFSSHPEAKNIKTAILILDPELPESVMRKKLEDGGFQVVSSVKIAILDLIAEYYNSHIRSQEEWNLLFSKKIGFFEKSNNHLRYAGIALLILAIIGAWFFLYFKFLSPQNLQPPAVQEPVPAKDAVPGAETSVTTPEAATTTSELPPAPINKGDFPIQIFNGTFVSGEASRLSGVIQAKGFTVKKVGNYENQNQLKTTLFVSEGTSDELVNELRDILEIYYQEVIISVTPVETKDIHIVIGRKK